MAHLPLQLVLVYLGPMDSTELSKYLLDRPTNLGSRSGVSVIKSRLFS